MSTEVFERAKLSLRKFLNDNKSMVISDLEKMRKLSSNKDIYGYIDSLNSSFSFENLTIPVYPITPQEINTCNFKQVVLIQPHTKDFNFLNFDDWKTEEVLKKDPEEFSGSFFFNIIVS